MHRVALGDQQPRHRLSWEEMPAGTAGGEDENGAHSSSPPSRRRVKASSMPMPSASAIIDDTP
jgi:hypothetical protein